MKRLALLPFAFAWLAACETPAWAPTSQTPLIPPPSFATTIANEKVSVAGSFATNTCPPEEEVQILNGFLHTLVTGEIGETSADVTIHVNAEDIEGVGLVTGARYSQPANSTDEITLTAVPFTQSEEFDLRYRLIREGSPDNLWLRITFTFTFPPGTEEIRRFEIECRG
jgi:hypothetical protein